MDSFPAGRETLVAWLLAGGESRVAAPDHDNKLGPPCEVRRRPRPVEVLL
jgi:hypothetical protein